MVKHRCSNVMLLIAIALTLIQILVTVFAYASMPDTIPAFVDVWGNPVRVMQKSILSVARFPMMSVLLLVLCATMYFAKGADSSMQVSLRGMWGAVAMVSSIKMTATTLEMAFPLAQGLLRGITLCMVAVGVGVIVVTLYRLYRRDKDFLKHMMTGMSAKRGIVVGAILGAYALVAIAPLMG